ncbi:MAG: hypothetical protein ACK5Y2_04180 [Bdellovibrionales bacterium]
MKTTAAAVILGVMTSLSVQAQIYQSWERYSGTLTTYKDLGGGLGAVIGGRWVEAVKTDCFISVLREMNRMVVKVDLNRNELAFTRTYSFVVPKTSIMSAVDYQKRLEDQGYEVPANLRRDTFYGFSDRIPQIRNASVRVDMKSRNSTPDLRSLQITDVNITLPTVRGEPFACQGLKEY